MKEAKRRCTMVATRTAYCTRVVLAVGVCGLGVPTALRVGEIVDQPNGDVPQSAITGALAEFNGTVTVHLRTGTISQPVLFQLLREGDALELRDRSHATVVCSNDSLVSLQGPLTWVLTQQSCERGKATFKGLYASVVGSGDSARVSGSLELEPPALVRGVRGIGGQPLLLSPLGRVSTTNPQIRWTKVADAARYQIGLSGPTSGSVVLDSADVRCDEPVSPVIDIAVCEVPFSFDAIVEREQPYFLAVSHVTNIASRFPSLSEGEAWNAISAEEAEAIQEEIEKLGALDVAATTRDLLMAHAYVAAELHAQALTYFRRLKEQNQSPALYSAVGDSYYALGLYELAASSYESALQLAQQTDDGVAIARALIALGRVDEATFESASAAERWTAAVEILQSLGITQQLDQLRNAIARTRQQP